MFLLLGRDFEHLLGQIVSIRVKSLSNVWFQKISIPPPVLPRRGTEIPKGRGRGGQKVAISALYCLNAWNRLVIYLLLVTQYIVVFNVM